jgi:energy-coupling factor transporter ATP-binding protein EcfA2
MNKTDINMHFKLPIFYNSKKKEINQSTVTDLELIKNIDETQESIYKHIFNPTHLLGTYVLDLFAKYYTTDVSFLKDTQQMLKTYKPLNYTKPFDIHEFNNILQAWNEIKGETGFCEKYLYIDWEAGKFLNTNSHFLQAMSIYNIASPILSLFLPIFILIVPFFMIKLKGVTITMNEYIDILKIIVSNHAIGKIFTSFHEVDSSQKIYLLASAAFYVFSIYQNILICIRFYSNAKKIHDYLFTFREYINYTILSMDAYLEITKPLSSYNEFNNIMINHKDVLLEFKQKLDIITPFKLSFNKIIEIGHILQCFYELYDNKKYNTSFLYSFGYHGYINNIEGLVFNIHKKRINKAKILKKQKKQKIREKQKSNTDANIKNIFIDEYYPSLINADHVKNTCSLETNIIITGPNASGKTTLLKTTIINVILSQQFGYGCYQNAEIIPYDFIHCYLNIPDTSGRDSLFQAEARRCKEIIDCITINNNKTHFCVFDELYSGTNPEEAIISGFAFLEYLTQRNNVTCILTTHYIEICNKLCNNTRIRNYNMKTIQNNNTFEYTYIFQEGISEIKGGLKVLSDLNYPMEIINQTKL